MGGFSRRQPEKGVMGEYTLHVKEALLYHGSKADGLMRLRRSEGGLFGSGVYLSTDLGISYEYSNGPLYLCAIKNMRLLQTGKQGVLAAVMDQLSDISKNPSDERAKTANELLTSLGPGVDKGEYRLIPTERPFIRKAAELLGFDGLIVGGNVLLIFDQDRVSIKEEFNVKTDKINGRAYMYLIRGSKVEAAW